MHINVNNISWTPQESAPAPAPDAPVHAPKPVELAVEEHPQALDIAMPVQEGRYIPKAVLASLDRQGIPYRLWLSTKYSNGETAAMRNNVRLLALKGSSPVILTMDNDIILPDGAVQAMMEWLTANPDFGAVAVSKHANPGMPGTVVEDAHVDAAPVLWRRDVFEVLDYTNTPDVATLADDGNRCCECLGSVNALRDVLGMRIGFLGGFVAKHIHDTMLGEVGG